MPDADTYKKKKKKYKKQNKAYYEDNKDKCLGLTKKYHKTEAGKESRKKANKKYYKERSDLMKHRKRYKKEIQDGVIVLKGFVNFDNDEIHVWCPFCEEVHVHKYNSAVKNELMFKKSKCTLHNKVTEKGYLVAPFMKEQVEALGIINFCEYRDKKGEVISKDFILELLNKNKKKVRLRKI